MTLRCRYCRRELDSPRETYRAIDGWETIDRYELTWRTLDTFACESCVDEHFVTYSHDDENDEADQLDNTEAD